MAQFRAVCTGKKNSTNNDISLYIYTRSSSNPIPIVMVPSSVFTRYQRAHKGLFISFVPEKLTTISISMAYIMNPK